MALCTLRNLVFMAAISGLLGGPALAQAPPDFQSDPKGYLVPESWRQQARTLIDPGRSGLTGGLVLERLELSTHMDATYRGKDAHLQVHLVPSKAAPESAHWIGKRIAIVEIERSGNNGKVDRALAELSTLIENRERSWGWLRVDPRAKEEKKEVLARRIRLKEARRLAWLGQADDAVRQVQTELRERRIDVSELLLASRVVHKTGRRELAHKIGKRALDRATQSVQALGIDARMKHRARLSLALAAALAGEPQAAMTIGRKLYDKDDIACEVSRIAEDLERADERDKARKLLAELQHARPACGAAWALAVDLARRGGDLDTARAIAEAGMKARRGAMAIHAALARLELVTGRPVEAVTRAETAAGRGRAEGDGLITLAAVVAEGHVQDARLETWDGEASRSPNQATKLALGAMASYGRGDFDGFANRLGAMRALVRSDHQLSALHAYALARQGRLADAKATLGIAWNENIIGAAHLAAEATLAAANGKDPAPAWKAYLQAATLDPGPVARGEMDGRVAVESANASRRPSREPAPGVAPQADGSGDADGSARWPWVLGGLLVVGAAAFLLRGRDA